MQQCQLLLLDDDTLALVLQCCRDTYQSMRPLKAASITCKRLCNLTRCHLSYHLRLLYDGRLCQLPAMAAATSTPFSGCDVMYISLSLLVTGKLQASTVAEAIAAPGRWPGLKRLGVSLGCYGPEDFRELGECLIQLFDSASSLQQLRQLIVQAPAPQGCLASLAAATQLTQLQLGDHPSSTGFGLSSLDLTVLSCLTNLQDLALRRCGFSALCIIAFFCMSSAEAVLLLLLLLCRLRFSHSNWPLHAGAPSRRRPAAASLAAWCSWSAGWRGWRLWGGCACWRPALTCRTWRCSTMSKRRTC